MLKTAIDNQEVTMSLSLFVYSCVRSHFFSFSVLGVLSNRIGFQWCSRKF